MPYSYASQFQRPHAHQVISAGLSSSSAATQQQAQKAVQDLFQIQQQGASGANTTQFANDLASLAQDENLPQDQVSSVDEAALSLAQSPEDVRNALSDLTGTNSRSATGANVQPNQSYDPTEANSRQQQRLVSAWWACSRGPPCGRLHAVCGWGDVQSCARLT